MADDVTPPAEPKPDGSQQQQINDIRAEQQRQSGVLDELLSLVKGGNGDKSRENIPAQQQPAKVAEADMAEQMRQAIRDVQAETAASAPPPKPEPEHAPREPGRNRQRMQKILFGKEAGRP